MGESTCEAGGPWLSGEQRGLTREKGGEQFKKKMCHRGGEEGGGGKGGGGRRGVDGEFGVRRCELSHLECVSNESRLCSAGSYNQSLGIEREGR